MTTGGVPLNEALVKVAKYLGFDAARLAEYAAEDAIGGWDWHVSQWPVGSIFNTEGQIMYALTRYMKPKAVFEIGTRAGCSATHFLSALEANQHGQMVSADITGGAGALIPDDLRPRLKLFNGQDGPTLLGQSGTRIKVGEKKTFTLPVPTIVFEDGSHKREEVKRAVEIAQAVLEPGGVLIVHDVLHWDVGKEVQGGIMDAGITDALYLMVDPSDTGFAIWTKPAGTGGY